MFLRKYLTNRDPVLFVLSQQACARALALDSDLLEVELALASLFRVAGDYLKSLDLLDESVRDHFGEADVHVERGHTLQRLGRIEEAEAAYLQAIEIEPNYWGVYADLANHYYDQADYENALILYQRTVDMPDAPSTTLQHSIGTVQFALGDFNQAVTAYHRVLAEQEKPRRATLTSLGLANYHLGCYAQAARWQREAVLLAPDDHRIVGRLAEACRFVEGGEDKAQELWEQAIKLANFERNQADWHSKGLLALYHAHRAEAEQARQALAAMWLLEPEPSMANYFAAIVEAKAGRDPTDAIRQALAHDFTPAFIDTDPDLSPQPICPLPVDQVSATEVCRVNP